jgi:ribonuclease E
VVEPPKRRTRARRTPKADAAVDSAVTNGAAAPVAIDGASVAPSAADMIQAEPAVNPEPEPVVAPEPEPRVLEVVAALTPAPELVMDPAEISTPPATPRRGWWRRGS